MLLSQSQRIRKIIVAHTCPECGKWIEEELDSVDSWWSCPCDTHFHFTQENVPQKSTITIKVIKRKHFDVNPKLPDDYVIVTTWERG